METGRHLGDRVEIVKGLEPGERIVVSGNFLIDSESKMSLAAAGMQPLLKKDPVCGQEVSPRKAEKQGRKVSTPGRPTTSAPMSTNSSSKKHLNNMSSIAGGSHARGTLRYLRQAMNRVEHKRSAND